MKAVLVACAVAFLAQGAARLGPGEQDVFAFVRAMDETGARQIWPGFSPSEWPVAVFDGTQTILLRYPNPPPEFTPVAGRPGVFAMAGRHPSVVGNSTREIGGVRTGTVIATAGQVPESTMLAYIEEVFHVFWLRRHANFRPDEMARYAYPVKDIRHLQLMLAEDEALARALESGLPQAAAWAAAVFRIRRERASLLTGDDRAYETGLEMMEGTANYVARAAIGQQPAATAARLRAPRDADGIRWRFYDTGAAVGFLLDRFQPDWKLRIDRELDLTTAGLLAEAIARSDTPPSSFSAAELAGFERRAAAAVAALSARQRSVREDLLGRAGPRVVVEVASETEPLRVTRFDPINLLVLDGGEIAHANYVTLTGPAGTIEVRNGAFARGSFAGTAALTRGAGRHPLGDGIRTVTVAGFAVMPKVESRDGVVTIEAEGLRLTLAGAVARIEGETVRIRLSPPRSLAPLRFHRYAHDAETEPVDGVPDVPKRRADEEPREIPAGAVEHVRRAVAFPGASIDRGSLEVRMPRILAPLGDVAEHVVEAEGIRLLEPYRVGGAARVLLRPCDGVQRAVGLLRRAGPAGVLPLSLAGKAIAAVRFQPVERSDERLSVLPTDHLDWRVWSCGLEVRRVVPHHGRPLGLGDLGDAHPERRHRHGVDRLFDRPHRRAHREAARWHADEPHPDAVAGQIRPLTWRRGLAAQARPGCHERDQQYQAFHDGAPFGLRRPGVSLGALCRPLTRSVPAVSTPRPARGQANKRRRTELIDSLV